MQIKFVAELEEAVQFEVELPGKIQEYADHFLIIVNNAREFPEQFYKVENNTRNSVFVTCKKSSRDSVKEFLEWHGKIVAESKVLVCRPEYVWSRQTSDYLDKLYEEDDSLADIVLVAPEDLF